MLEYQTLARYGPTLFSVGAVAIYIGIEGYAKAKEKPSLPNPISFALKMAAGSALFGMIMADYNTVFFEIVGYSVGWLNK